MKTKDSRGGKREGAGRKKMFEKEKTVVFSMRVPESMYNRIPGNKAEYIRTLISMEENNETQRR